MVNRNGPALWQAILEVVGLHFEPVIAGGCIRDHLLGIEPKDIDVFVPASWAEDVVSIVLAMDPKVAEGRFIWAVADQGRAEEVHAYLVEQGVHEGCEIEYEGDGFAPDLIAVWEGEILGVPVNIIGRKTLEDGPEALVRTFDFDILKGWYDPQLDNRPAPAYEAEMLGAFALKQATLAHNGNLSQSLARFARFEKRNPGLLKLVNPYARETECFP